MLLLGACSSFNMSAFDLSGLKYFVGVSPELQTISLRAENDVNGGYPLAVDVLLISDKKVFEALSNLRATEWFSGRTDYLRQHQKNIFLTAWELVPGQRLENVSLLQPDDAVVGALVFADYPGERTYRAAVLKQ